MLRGTESFHTRGTRNSEYSAKRVSRGLPSVAICDLFPYSCIRLPHSRYILPSDHLPLTEIRRGILIRLTEGLLEQYQVDSDEVMDTLSQLLDGKAQVMMGISDRPVCTSDYVCNLAKVWKAGALVIADTTQRGR